MPARTSNDLSDRSAARRSAIAVVTREPARSVVAGSALGALLLGAAFRRARRRRSHELSAVLRR